VESTWLDLSAPEVVISILNSAPPSRSEAFEFLTRYSQAARLLIDVLDDILKSSRIVNLTSTKLGREDMRGLFSAAVAVEDGDLDRAVDELNTRLEGKIRAAFHLAFALQYGTGYSSQLPSSVIRRIAKQANKDTDLRRKTDPNLFYHCSRGDYAEIVNTNQHWDRIFRAVFAGMKKEDVVSQIHRSFTLDTRHAHRDKPEYFREVRQQVARSVADGKGLLELLDTTFGLALRPPGLEGTKVGAVFYVQVSFVDATMCAQSTLWKLPETLVNEIYLRLQRHSSRIELANDAAVAAALGHSSPYVCLVAAGLIKRNMITCNFEDTPSQVVFARTNPTQDS
jgi:hypothetical protein